MIKLNKDNNFGAFTDNKEHKKRSITIDKQSLIFHIKRRFRWRKGDMLERLYQLGSTEFDNFVNYLIDLGY